jgi:cysteinyl-tRNA synthetase
LADSGIVRTVARLGFDGIYLDGLDAYDDPDVLDAAHREHVDAGREMIDFVARLRGAGRSVIRDFLVIAQNAPYLLDRDPERYAAAIDALAVEDTWFRGAGDAAWDAPGAGDLINNDTGIWSTSSRLAQYRKYMTRGLPVFSVDYCRNTDNAQKVYQAARQAGLRPLVTRVALSRMTATPPPAD